MGIANVHNTPSRFYFKALLVVGLVLLLFGLFFVPVLPHFQLDAVLTKAELADQGKRQATLELLKRASGNQWLFWSVAGVLVSSLSAIGLWNCRPTSDEPPNSALVLCGLMMTLFLTLALSLHGVVDPSERGGTDGTNVPAIKVMQKKGAPESLAKAIPLFFPASDTVDDLEIIAWSCKADFDEAVPQLWDDVLVLVKLGKTRSQWALLSLRRIRGSGRLENWVHNMRWMENSCGNSLTWVQIRDSRPDVAAVMEFAKESNFGLNELFSDHIETLAVYLYMFSTREFVKALADGVSPPERTRRRDRFMEMNASPIPSQ